jgi:hypothetical protein
MTDPAIAAAHAASVRLDVPELARRLNGALGATLVAALAGSKDPKISYKWAKIERSGGPRSGAIRRLQFAYAQWLLISGAEGEQVARVWFLSSNPLLDYDTPVDAIREGRFKETAIAVKSMLDDSFSG